MPKSTSRCSGVTCMCRALTFTTNGLGGPPGVRAADAWNVESARLSRAHNNANVLCVGSRLVPEAEAFAIVDAWLDTEFEGGRHARRVDKIAALEVEEARRGVDGAASKR